MPFMSLIVPAGLGLLGAISGSKEKTTGEVKPTSSTTVSSGSHGSSTQNKIDPRMEQAIYGAGGIMPNVAEWYKQNQSGMNDKMLTGMNNQWNQLGASKQGFDQMQNLGMGLMAGGAAGNPFTGGGGIAPGQVYFKPPQMETSANANSPFTMPAPAAAPAMLPAYEGGGGGGGGVASPYPEAQVAVVDYAGPRNGVGMGGLGGRGGDSRGTWMEDTEGMGYWSGENRAGSYTGYRGDAYSPPAPYQFNNGYTAYGADGSSAANPSGGGY